jgi:hypothetical protein
MPFATYDTQDEVPEELRDVYEEKDGKWQAKVPDVANLNSALQAERTKAATEEAARKKAERELGDIKRKTSAEQHGITEEQLQALRDEDSTKRKPLEDEIATLRTENDKLTRLDKVRATALHNGVMADRIEDAMLSLDGRTRLTDAKTIVVLDKDGNATTEKLEDFLGKTFRAEKPWLYAGSGGSGSGTPPNIDSDAPPEPTDRGKIVDRKRRETAYGSI